MMSQPDFRFTLDGKLVEVTVTDLTFEDIELIEEAFDRPFSQVDFDRVKAMRLLAFCALRKTNSQLRPEDLAGLKLSALEAAPVEEEEGDERPTRRGSGGKAATKKAA